MFTVPAGLVKCVYRPYGANEVCLPSLCHMSKKNQTANVCMYVCVCVCMYVEGVDDFDFFDIPQTSST